MLAHFHACALFESSSGGLGVVVWISSAACARQLREPLDHSARALLLQVPYRPRRLAAQAHAPPRISSSSRRAIDHTAPRLPSQSHTGGVIAPSPGRKTVAPLFAGPVISMPRFAIHRLARVRRIRRLLLDTGTRPNLKPFDTGNAKLRAIEFNRDGVRRRSSGQSPQDRIAGLMSSLTRVGATTKKAAACCARAA